MLIEILESEDYAVRVNDDLPLRGTFRTIGSVVRGFKIAVTKWSRKNAEIYNVWQRNYYDNIIRNEAVYLKVLEYMENNPLKWEEDKYYENKKCRGKSLFTQL